ncbi:16S rRNA (cytosine(1402)-N(4))-methyltransferase RsmH [Wohlfahrtiimonas chitiniclastica]|uniref:Ribosomal RNA small subunit methyltransferase H n=1 Tax=Wohlfahrtiimonas chitiniclastica TaxID=400946 RepID=A0AB35C1J7_9GAMM|nr:16S rRNA (cytosine(1402)-N(4))-methyltransferase RsmH [Wohlfahrtiimonas chitiniclastica]KZS22810.1 16S rRNA (cytosine(1402)-N(4))-methyltransferase [Wohlfahrtiimonas chitiniclastica]MBS7825072.1 16S rRNA (cytosine(1402)-N(4))-methyltransferase RsmH [Wohlfahrtiimonas chitiniclastica]MBS7833932.1 16S rRNA (cytosine(1402)-N(4))-methyltransferase RsmH [Wohlfahrtiimonas chitiniclastica]MBS7840677.1 16S rRNA (cytosine(1402)-N(4))-methyltransferase RsmH [Wohlfahrtiimonas chitiniclastica]OYQ75983.1
MSEFQHVSVLLNEAINALNIQPAGVYVDGTFGRGGHSSEILKRLTAGHLISIDRDPTAQACAKERFKGAENFTFFAGCMSDIKAAVASAHFEKVDGVLLDIGVSSPQLDDAERGFSFMKDGPLDMRMDPTSGVSAATWVATSDFATMASVFREFGEERFAGKIAGHIIKCRELAPIETTHQLADIISEAVPFKDKHKHPATRVFQAIRIAVNEELTELSQTLNAAYDLLNPGGRLVVISFHSLEDRIVKNFMNHHAKPKDLLPDLPVAQFVSEPTLKLIGKPVKASDEESRHNPRARSAIMRIAEKLP